MPRLTSPIENFATAPTAVFGPLVLALMEVAKTIVKGGKWRRGASAALSIALPVAYQASQGPLDWRVVPFVWVIAFAIAFGGHKLRNANEAASVKTA